MVPALTTPYVAIQVSTYSVILALYFPIAIAVTERLNRTQGLPSGVTFAAALFAVPAGIIGARLLDMMEYEERYRSLADVLGRSGSSIYGAFVAYTVVIWVYLARAGIRPLRFFDAGAPAMALGEAMTRVGCFLNGCCYGIPWNGPLAAVFPRESFAYRDQIARGLLAVGAPHSLPVVPVQLVSAGLAFIAFVALLRMFLRRHREGVVFCAFLVFYGALRLGMAPLRQEALASMKAFSIVFIAVGALGMLLARREAPALVKPARRLGPAR